MRIGRVLVIGSAVAALVAGLLLVVFWQAEGLTGAWAVVAMVLALSWTVAEVAYFVVVLPRRRASARGEGLPSARNSGRRTRRSGP